MSVYTKAFELVEELKSQIDFEFRGKIAVSSCTSGSLYEVRHNRILISSKLIHDPESLYFYLMMARKELRIYSRLGHGNLWIGSFIYSFLTSLLWFPMYFSYFWYKYEKEVAKEYVRAAVTLYGPLQTKSLTRSIKRNCELIFVHKKYWLWPVDVNEWLQKVHYEILLEEGLQ